MHGCPLLRGNKCMGYSGCPLLRGPFIGGMINWCRSGGGGGHSEACITYPNKKWRW